MNSIASRELRNSTRALLERVEAGEDIAITVDGRPAAMLTQIPSKVRWLSRARFLQMISDHQADAGLRSVLDELAPDSTDDLPL